MSEIFKKRMALHGDTVSDSLRKQSDYIMDKTFTNDTGYRSCKLYDRSMNLLEENVDVKYQYSQVYTLNKDQVEYLAQFRPGYFPEKKYLDSDGVERLGFYLEIPDKNAGDTNMWLILGRNDKSSNIRYNVLKCNWTFKWIKDNVIHTCLGVIRNRNNYNSGVWSDGFFTSVDNQSQFIVPTNEDTVTIDYNDRFMLSDTSVRPLVYEVSKLEDTFPRGTTKVTLKQDHYNPHADNAELKICNYYSPIEPKEEFPEIKISGTSYALRIGGSAREVTVPDSSTVKFSFDGQNDLFAEELAEDFDIEVNDNTLTISAIKNFANLGKVLKIYDNHSSIQLEVIR